MAVCYFLTNQFEKSIDKATLSLDLRPTIKAYYRRAQAYAKLANYERAIEDLTAAIKMDTSDPNDF